MRAAVYTGTRNLYEHMMPAMKSLLCNSEVDKIYLLIEDDSFPYPLPPEAETINVSNQKWFKKDGPNNDTQFKPLCLMRAAYTKVLPKEVDKILQLDVDTVVVRNIDRLWDVDLSGKYFAAVPELKGDYRPYGPVYYNAGVMMLNLDEIRKDKMDDTLIEFLNTEKVPYIDQDAWNKYGTDKAAALNVAYNECFVTGYTSRPRIVHFAGFKDWTTNRSMWRREYLDQYDRMTLESILKRR